ncbi:hypothetical protein SAMD00023353_1401310 [Rosellinia necatrix]|uniref:Uncharacterized protein n=1 Tax=Rosellinia necatrix TaxID=77044 RepID=A0A1S8A6X6_ROSNE|nr:hypothetical protein SAMD00023353_1401310 [Rosellinia necatrix]
MPVLTGEIYYLVHMYTGYVTTKGLRSNLWVKRDEGCVSVQRTRTRTKCGSGTIAPSPHDNHFRPLSSILSPHEGVAGGGYSPAARDLVQRTTLSSPPFPPPWYGEVLLDVEAIVLAKCGAHGFSDNTSLPQGCHQIAIGVAYHKSLDQQPSGKGFQSPDFCRDMGLLKRLTVVIGPGVPLDGCFDPPTAKNVSDEYLVTQHSTGVLKFPHAAGRTGPVPSA